MRHRAIGRSDVWWSFATLFLQHSAPFIVLPVVMHYLTVQELGVWYAYQLAAGLATLLEFGYQSSFFRNIAYVAGGARDLQKEGTPAPSAAREHGTVDYSLMASLLLAMRRRYRRIALWIALALATLGSAYIAHLAPEIGGAQRLAPSWILFIAAATVSFYLSHYNTILYALNEVRTSQKAQVTGRVLSVIFTCLFLYLGFGLFGAVVGYFVGSFVPPYLSLLALRRIPVYRKSAETAPARDLSELDAIIWHNARKLGTSMIGVFVTQRGTALIVSLYLSLSEFAAFSITLQVFYILASLARVKLQVALATLSAHAARSERTEFRRLFVSSMKLGVLMYLAGAGALLLIGAQVLALITDKVTIVPHPALTLLVVLYLFEIIHNNSSWALTCFNTVPFMWPTWITGSAIVVGSVLVGSFTDWGITGFVAVQLGCQLAYNAWKWPLSLAAQCAEPARQGAST